VQTAPPDSADEAISMSQSLSQIYLHVVFSTKDRKPYLQDPAAREAMQKCLAKTCNELDCPCLEAGGVEDHVHVLVRLSCRTLSGFARFFFAYPGLPTKGRQPWAALQNAFSVHDEARV
jgi:hypothetical protein